MTTACIVFDISTCHQRTQLTTLTDIHQRESLARARRTVSKRLAVSLPTNLGCANVAAKVARYRTPRCANQKRRIDLSCPLALSALSDPNRTRCQWITQVGKWTMLVDQLFSIRDFAPAECQPAFLITEVLFLTMLQVNTPYYEYAFCCLLCTKPDIFSSACRLRCGSLQLKNCGHT